MMRKPSSRKRGPRPDNITPDDVRASKVRKLASAGQVTEATYPGAEVPNWLLAINKLQASVDALTTKVTKLDTKVSRLDTKVNKLDTTILDLGAQIRKEMCARY